MSPMIVPEREGFSKEILLGGRRVVDSGHRCIEVGQERPMSQGNEAARARAGNAQENEGAQSPADDIPTDRGENRPTDGSPA